MFNYERLKYRLRRKEHQFDKIWSLMIACYDDKYTETQDGSQEVRGVEYIFIVIKNNYIHTIILK